MSSLERSAVSPTDRTDLMVDVEFGVWMASGPVADRLVADALSMSISL